MNFKELYEGATPQLPGAVKGVQVMTPQQFVAKAGDMPGEESDEEGVEEGYVPSNPFNATDFKRHMDTVVGKVMGRAPTNKYQVGQIVKYEMDPPQEGGSGVGKITRVNKVGDHYEIDGSKIVNHFEIKGVKQPEQGVSEGEDHLSRIRKLSGLDEATKLPAQSRDLGGQEFQDYMKRIQGTPDVDKAGNVKVDKKGNEKYVTGKTKTDKYKMPYIHRSSVITYLLSLIHI